VSYSVGSYVSSLAFTNTTNDKGDTTVQTGLYVRSTSGAAGAQIPPPCFSCTSNAQ
jgi:hypothetical protein